jgi:hypothetical protein
LIDQRIPIRKEQIPERLLTMKQDKSHKKLILRGQLGGQIETVQELEALSRS